MALAAVRPDMLYAWSGPSLLVVNTRGESAEDQRLSGYYFEETRFLRMLQLRINGHTPWPCEAASVAPDTLTFTYVHPEITTPTGGGTGQAGDEENTAHDLAKATFDLAQLYPEHRIPECIGGYARSDAPTQGAYPRANTPQLWNATSVTLTCRSSLACCRSRRSTRWWSIRDSRSGCPTSSSTISTSVRPW
jgi:N-terminal domain of (some) glycogen debranching enzymes